MCVCGAASARFASATTDVTMTLAAGYASSDDPTYTTSARNVYTSIGQGDLDRRFYTTYTYIIQVDKGNITSVVMDTGCYLCGADACGAASSTGHENCYVKTDACQSTANGENIVANSCDPKIFVVWTGTDADGEYLTSAGYRLSRFRRYGASLPNAWAALRNGATNAVNRLNPVRPV
ncbi:hypothetical protein EON67_01505 [archaeon]|nr:MAG: hypothetical protein EON67_01505 [archaeon]